MTTLERPTRPLRGRKALDLTDQTFGRLTVLRRGPNRGAHAAWYCLCDCGTVKHVSGRDLRYGRTKSCGCLYDETH